MKYVGGRRQEAFVGRIRGIEPDRLLAVPIDVGKRTAAAMVCDFWGEVIASPFEFQLNEEGYAQLRGVVARAEVERDAGWIRVGVEQAGHYHDTLIARLAADGLDVVLLSATQVKDARSEGLLGTLKSDTTDLAAMAELLSRGRGHPTPAEDGALARQAVLAAHRRRKIKARTVLKNQVLATLDLVFPGLDGCFARMLHTKAGRVLLANAMTPDRVARLGPKRLRAFMATRDVMMTRVKADEITQAARLAFRLPPERVAAHLEVLRADVSLLDRVEQAIEGAEAELADALPDTPAAILTTIPYVGVVRASAYGASLGDPSRFGGAAQVYRMSGLVPRQYESAGKKRIGTAISREGKVELREAILELGKALRSGHPEFARYAASLKERGKPGGIIACALGHRANRIAFAMMRDQRPFAPERWPISDGRARHGRFRPGRRHPSV